MTTQAKGRKGYGDRTENGSSVICFALLIFCSLFNNHYIASHEGIVLIDRETTDNIQRWAVRWKQFFFLRIMHVDGWHSLFLLFKSPAVFVSQTPKKKQTHSSSDSFQSLMHIFIEKTAAPLLTYSPSLFCSVFDISIRLITFKQYIETIFFTRHSVRAFIPSFAGFCSICVRSLNMLHILFQYNS